jgi:hypothetical protein
MNVLKRLIALFSFSAILLTMVPAIPGVETAFAAAPTTILFGEMVDDGVPATNALMYINPIDGNGASAAPLNASTVYTLYDSDDAQVAQVTGTSAADIGDGEDPPYGMVYMVEFPGGTDVTTGGYYIDVDFEGGGVDFQHEYIHTAGGFVTYIDSTNVIGDQMSFPFVTEVYTADSGMGTNEVAVWFDPAMSPASTLTYTSNSGNVTISPPLGENFADISELPGVGDNTVFKLTFTGETFADGNGAIDGQSITISNGEGPMWENLPVQDFADFMALLTNLNDDDKGGGSEFSAGNFTVGVDDNQNITKGSLYFTDGFVSTSGAAVSTSNYMFTPSGGDQPSWGGNITSVTVPGSCDQGDGTTSCVLIAVSGGDLLAGFLAVNYTNITSTASDTLSSGYNTTPWWYYSNATPDVMYTEATYEGSMGWANGSYYAVYDCEMSCAWVISDDVRADNILLYGLEDWNDGGIANMTFYTDSDRQNSDATTDGSSVLSGATNASLNGTYTLTSLYQYDAFYMYLAGTNITQASLETLTNYTVTVPSGSKAGTYNALSVDVNGNRVAARFLPLGLANSVTSLDAPSYTLTLGTGICDDTPDCFDGSALPAFTAGTIVQSANPTYSSNVNFTYVDPSAVTETVTASVSRPMDEEPGGAEGIFTITADSAVDDAGGITINYSITGTAVEAADYMAFDGTATLGNGETSVDINTFMVDDLDIDPGETIILTIDSGEGYSVGGQNVATMKISDGESVDPALFYATFNATADPSTQTGLSAGDQIQVDFNVSCTDCQILLDGDGSSQFITGITGASYSIDTTGFSENMGYSVLAYGDDGTRSSGNSMNFILGENIDRPFFDSSPTSLNDTISITYDTSSVYCSSGEYVFYFGNSDFSTSKNSGAIVDSGWTVPTPSDLALGATDYYGKVACSTGGYESDPTDPLSLADPSNPTVSASVTDTAEEPSTDGLFTLTADAEVESDTTINYTITGTATNGTDYQTITTPGTAIISSGLLTTTVTVPITDDGDIDPSETIILTIGSGDGYQVGSAATMTITDNEVSPTVSASLTTDATEPSTDGLFTLTADIAVDSDTTVNYTIGGTATGGTDFTSPSGSVVISSGQTTATVSIPIIDEDDDDDGETVDLTIASGSGYVYVVGAGASMTIGDDDEPTTFAATLYSADCGGECGNMTSSIRIGITDNIEVVYDEPSLCTDPSGCDLRFFTLSELQAGLSSMNANRIYTGLTNTTNFQAGSVLTNERVYQLSSLGSNGWTAGTTYWGYTTEENNGDHTTPLQVEIEAAGPSFPAAADIGGLDWDEDATPESESTIILFRESEGTLTPADFTITVDGGGAVAAESVTHEVDGVDMVMVVFPSSVGDLTGHTVLLSVSGETTDLSMWTTEEFMDVMDGGSDSPGISFSNQAGTESGSTNQTFTQGDTAYFQATIWSSQAQDSVAVDCATNQCTTYVMTESQMDTGIDNSGYEKVVLWSGTGVKSIGTSDLDNGDYYIITKVVDGEDTSWTNMTHMAIEGGAAPLPTVTVAATDDSAAETATDPGTFTVSRTGDTAADLTVYFSLTGTATDALDYTSSSSGSVIISSGFSSAAVTIIPIDDASEEGSESVSLVISDNAAYTAGSPSSANITIADNDGAGDPTVSASVTTTGGEPSTSGLFTLTADSAVESDTTVNYSIGGTAVAGTDYTSPSGSAVISSGQTTTTVSLTVLNDEDSDMGETVILTVTSGTGYEVGSAATMTITDDGDSGDDGPDPVSDLPTISMSGPDGGGNYTGTLAEDTYISLEEVADPEADGNGVLIYGDTIFTTTESWDGELNIGSTTDMSAQQEGIFMSANAFAMEHNLSSDIALSDPAVAFITYDGFSSLPSPFVGIMLAGGGESVPECTAEQFNFDTGDIGDSDDYTLAAGEYCYVVDVDDSQQDPYPDAVYIATKLLGVFVAGVDDSGGVEGEGEGEGEGESIQVLGYGPNNGDTGVPSFAPVEIFLSADPSQSVMTPLMNSTDSVVSIVDTGTGQAVEGEWFVDMMYFGDVNPYLLAFGSFNGLPGSSTYKVSIKKTLVDGGVNLMSGFDMSALTDDGTAYSFTFSTGESTAASDWMDGTEWEGDLGGEFPPMSWLSFPEPQKRGVPSNLASIVVEFDRDMDATTFADNIYLKKMVDDEESGSLPSGTVSLSPTTGESDIVTISGYTLEDDSEYRVIVERDVKTTSGDAIAGMPLDEDGNPQGGGFGWGNMGSMKETFFTGESKDITTEFDHVNLEEYESGGDITGVPTSTIIRANFTEPLDASTLNSTNVTLANGGSVAGNISYDSWSNAIIFEPSAVLTASTEHTFTISTGVKSVTGTAISSQEVVTFTTGAADTSKPTLRFAEGDNFGLRLEFDEMLNEDKATNVGNYTLKTCSGATFSSSTECAGGGSPSTVSMFTGVNIHYEPEWEGSFVKIDGLDLTPGDGFYIEVSTGVTDSTGNTIDATANSRKGVLMDGSFFDGGQGMFNMDTMGFDDMDMGMMGMNPINVMPADRSKGVSSKYWIDMPVEKQIPANGFIEFTFPSGKGFDVSAVQASGCGDMGGLSFASTNPVFQGNDTDNGGATLDGIGVVGATKIYVQLASATAANDFLFMDLEGITNATEKGEYQVQIKTFNDSGVMLEAMTAMPMSIESGGENTLSGTITDDSANPLEGVTVIMEWPYKKTTTTNSSGVYTFTGLRNYEGYGIKTEREVEISGSTYEGQDWPVDFWMTANIADADFTLNKVNSSNDAAVNVLITSATLDNIDTLGGDDSLDVFASSWTGFRVMTLTRSDISSHIADPAGNPIVMYLPQEGNWDIGVGPAMAEGTCMTGGMGNDWMMIPPQNIYVESSDLGGTADTLTFAIEKPTSAIAGKVVDSQGNGISNTEVYAYSPTSGGGSFTKADSDGTFSMPIGAGNYIVGAFSYGMGNSQEVGVFVDGEDDKVYIAGDDEGSTGASGDNPFNLRIGVNTSGSTITGEISDGTNKIEDAAVWAWSNGNNPPVAATTNASGIYTLFVEDGSWTIEADAPGFGYIGSIEATISGESLTGQDFTVNTDSMGTIQGTVSGSSGDGGGVWISASNNNYWNEATTNTDGEYTIRVPYGTYSLEAYSPITGYIGTLEGIVVDGDETGKNFSKGVEREFSITLSESLGEESTVTFLSLDSPNIKPVHIPAGSTASTASLKEGSYYVQADIPGVSSAAISISGADYESSRSEISIDGSGDDISINIGTINSLTGRVRQNGTGLNDAFVNVLNAETGMVYDVTTGNDDAGGGLDGEYLLYLSDGTYQISVSKPGYQGATEEVTISGDSTGNDFVLVSNSRTISGTVSSGGTGVSGSTVSAKEINGEGFSAAVTDSDGSYTVSVGEGTWTVEARAAGYSPSTTTEVEVSSENIIGKNFTLSLLTGDDVMADPKTESMNLASGGPFNAGDIGVSMLIPGNVLGSSNGQITAEETNNVVETKTSTPVGTGKSITAKDADGQPITNLSGNVTIELELTLAELEASDITTRAQVKSITLGYWSPSIQNWGVLSTSVSYYDADGEILPEYTWVAVEDLSRSLEATGVALVKLTGTTNHFTVFAPIIPTEEDAEVDAAPATPTGLSATAGDAQVTLSWTANSEGDMSSYNIWEANVTEGVLTTLAHASCSEGTCTKTITSLTNGTAYAFQIIAVDAGANTSAGSTSATATPAAAGSPAPSTPSGGSGVVYRPSSTDDEPVEDDDEVSAEVLEEIAEFILDTVEENVELSNVGEVPQDTAIASSDSNTIVTFLEATVVVDDSGETYTGGIPSPESTESPKLPPSGKALLGDVYEVGVEGTKLFFSKPVSLKIKLPESADLSKELIVYYFDEDYSDWKVAGNGGQLVVNTAGEYFMDVDVYHMTKFGIMQTIVDASVFSDIASHWARSYIEELYELGGAIAYYKDTYAPDKPMTRLDVVRTILTTLDIDVPESGSISTNPFPDVPASSWRAPYIQKAKTLGFISGYDDDGTFRPDESVSRAEIMKIIFKATGLKATTRATTPFKDVPVGYWYSNYILSGYKLGVISGKTADTFALTDPVSRAEATKIIIKMTKLKNLRDKLLNIGFGN